MSCTAQQVTCNHVKVHASVRQKGFIGCMHTPYWQGGITIYVSRLDFEEFKEVPESTVSAHGPATVEYRAVI